MFPKWVHDQPSNLGVNFVTNDIWEGGGGWWWWWWGRCWLFVEVLNFVGVLLVDILWSLKIWVILWNDELIVWFVVLEGVKLEISDLSNIWIIFYLLFKNILVEWFLKSRVSDLDCSLNRKRERFKVLDVEPRLNQGRTVMTS